MTDLSLFDTFDDQFIDELREAMDKLAFMGEQYIKGKHGSRSSDYGGSHAAWNNDTSSLLASVTGYEAKIGNYQENFDDARWQHARAVGSDQYPYNRPEHYQPHVESRDLGESENPVAVLTYFTQYPDPDLAKDAALEAAVTESLTDAHEFMKNHLVSAVKDSLRKSKGSVFVLP